ncbi:uncharacterized protein LTR77_003915 [Saxophila tyrrhenica]|uniref:Major facilitator superfamily (MFS) profile domain-containing protein n=1 Tax=Saxophila tyrrhenica TaxID=1690608 RepID=A0AAV9PJ91_9PEZI|nr:hypothetical protein LTR77_003915 [Saxophila tyrrhenica]
MLLSDEKLESFRTALRPLTLVIYTSSLLLDVMNSTGVTFILPRVAEEYHLPYTEATWMLSAYALTFGAFLLVVGRLGDVVGHKEVYILGLTLFSVFSALAAGVNTAVGLFVVRAFQGAFAAMTVPSAYALVSISYTGRAREMALSMLGMGIATGSTVGIIVGGAVTKLEVGYRLLFWISFALSIVFALLSAILVPPTPRNLALFRRIDFFGTFLITASILLIVLGLSEGPTDWQAARALSPLLVGIAMLAAFITYENIFLRRTSPSTEALIPPRVWTFKNFAALVPVTALMYGTCFMMLLVGSQFLVNVQGKPALTAAIQYLPFAIAPLIAMPILGALYSKINPKWTIMMGEILAIAGCILFSRNDERTHYWSYSFPGLILISLGVACFFVNFLNLAVASAPLPDQGLVAGIMQSAAQVSVAIFYAISGSFIDKATPQTILSDYRNAFYCATAAAAAALVITAFLIHAPSRDESTHEAVPSATQQETEQEMEQDPALH